MSGHLRRWRLCSGCFATHKLRSHVGDYLQDSVRCSQRRAYGALLNRLQARNTWTDFW